MSHAKNCKNLYCNVCESKRDYCSICEQKVWKKDMTRGLCKLCAALPPCTEKLYNALVFIQELYHKRFEAKFGKRCSLCDNRRHTLTCYKSFYFLCEECDDKVNPKPETCDECGVVV